MGINLFFDNGSPDQWEEAHKLGIFEGITTNPSILKEANQSNELNNIKKLVKAAEAIGFREIHIQTWGDTLNELIDRGLKIGELSTSKIRVFIKIPITETGTMAGFEIIKRGFPITFTACYEISQVIIASAIGASYIAPYLGRINDKDNSGISKIIEMKKILKATNSTCKLLVASIRECSQIEQLAAKGIDTFTINKITMKDIFKSKSTDDAFLNFNKAAFESIN